MIHKTSQYLVALTLGVMAWSIIFFAGCSREASSDAPTKPLATKADQPSVYMKDPAFTNALAKQRAERRAIQAANEKLLSQMEAMIDAMREKMKGASDEAVRKELEKDPEWNSLVNRLKDAQAAFEDNRKATTKIVGDRLRPHPVTDK